MILFRRFINENIVNFYNPGNHSQRGGSVPLAAAKYAIMINDSMPGPSIWSNVGDIVNITVNNQLMSDSVAIHWHGIQQLGSPWSDGAEWVSQVWFSCWLARTGISCFGSDTPPECPEPRTHIQTGWSLSISWYLQCSIIRNVLGFRFAWLFSRPRSQAFNLNLQLSLLLRNFCFQLIPLVSTILGTVMKEQRCLVQLSSKVQWVKIQERGF